MTGPLSHLDRVQEPPSDSNLPTNPNFSLTSPPSTTHPFVHPATDTDPPPPPPNRDQPISSTQAKIDSIRIIQLNICGLRSKRAEAELLCRTRKADIACFQESHCKPNAIPPTITGFTAVARADRKDGWGGVITYLRNDLTPNLTKTSTTTSHKVQQCKVEIRTRRGLLKIANIYCAPGWYQSDMQWLQDLESDTILLGDVNAKGSWDKIIQIPSATGF